MDVGEWLRGLGLGQYEAAFRENEIDAEVLPKLTSEDLKEIGVASSDIGGSCWPRSANCLRPVAPAVAAEPPPPADALAETAERRQLTVMFCDLVGSTALSARLDPEDLRGVIGAYHRCCAEEIERNGGFVAKYMGDGVLAYFGYPRADEHDAESAVRAGLALVEAAPKLNTAAGVPVAGAGRDRDRPRGGRRSARRGRRAGTGGGRGDAEPRGPAAGDRRTRRGGDRREHAPTDGRAVRISRPRRRRPQGLRRGRSGAGRRCARARPRAGSRRCTRRRRRWSAATRRSSCCCAAGTTPSAARAGSCCCRASRASANRASCRRCWSGSAASRIPDCAISARPTTRTARSIRAITQLERAAGFRREDSPEQKLAKLETVLALGTNDLGQAVPLLADMLWHPDRRPLSAARSDAAKAEGEDASCDADAGGGAGGATAGADGVRGHSLERPDDARILGPADRSRSHIGSPVGPHVPAGIRSALDRPPACERARPQPPAAETARRDDPPPDRRQDAAEGDRRSDHRTDRWRAAVHRGTDQDRHRERHRCRDRRGLRRHQTRRAAGYPDDAARLAARAARSSGADARGRADRGGARAAVLARADQRRRADAPRSNSTTPSSNSSAPSCCSGAARRPTPNIHSSTLWCRRPPTAHCCAAKSI